MATKVGGSSGCRKAGMTEPRHQGAQQHRHNHEQPPPLPPPPPPPPRLLTSTTISQMTVEPIFALPQICLRPFSGPKPGSQKHVVGLWERRFEDLHEDAPVLGSPKEGSLLEEAYRKRYLMVQFLSTYIYICIHTYTHIYIYIHTHT